MTKEEKAAMYRERAKKARRTQKKIQVQKEAAKKPEEATHGPA